MRLHLWHLLESITGEEEGWKWTPVTGNGLIFTCQKGSSHGFATLVKTKPLGTWQMDQTIHLSNSHSHLVTCATFSIKHIVYIRVRQNRSFSLQLEDKVHNLMLINVCLYHFEIYCVLKMHGLSKVLEVWNLPPWKAGFWNHLIWRHDTRGAVLLYISKIRQEIQILALIERNRWNSVTWHLSCSLNIHFKPTMISKPD